MAARTVYVVWLTCVGDSLQLCADASFAFPLIVAETFARYQQQFDQRLEKEKSLPKKTA